MADAKKLVGGLGKVSQQLLAPSKELTAAERAEAGRKAAALIKSQPQVKASEALGQLMEKGFKKTTTTQADRTRVGRGNIGGAPFPAISEADPAYADKVWGVFNEGTANRLINLTSPDTAWTTMLGTEHQLKTNPIVFDKLKRGFVDSMKQGNLSDDLAKKINHNLELTFGEGADIRDPKIWKQADTFEKRAALSNIMMGKGIPPSEGGVALGGEKSGKGVIFRPSDILKRETEPYLLHTEHGGDVPTFAAGPRLFRLDKETEFRPDLHPGFPTLIKGKDLEYNMAPVPTEIYLPDWHAKFKKDNPNRKPPSYFDLALGVKGEGLPSQDLNDEYIRHLLREGNKDGGVVDIDAADARLAAAIEKRMAKGGSVDIEAADARLEAAINARMGMAEGGEAGFKKIQFMADGGKLVKGLGKIGKKLMADDVMPAAEREANLNKMLSESKVKDKLFHGTTKDVKSFDQSKAGKKTGNLTTALGTFLSDSPQEASRYAKDWGAEGGNVMPVFAQLKNPYEMPYSEFNNLAMGAWNRRMKDPDYDPKSVVKVGDMDAQRRAAEAVNKHEADALQDVMNRREELMSQGYDSVMVKIGGNNEIIVFDPTKIKSATGNRGTYDMTDPDITKAEGGQVEFKKLEFMADGGKLVKGLNKIGKNLFADSKVLPQTEREANLQKFLEKSKVKEKMYRGATPHFQLEGEPIFVSPTVRFAEKFPVGSASPRIAANQNQTIYPLHVNATNPFDYENTNDIQKVIYEISKSDPEQAEKLKNEFKYYLDMGDKFGSQTGNWGLIENTLVQDAIKKLGYDSFYVNEEGVKNLGVYNPNQVKTAIGNRGTYDIEDADITKADGGKIVGGLGKIAKKLLEEPRIQTIEAPSIIIPSKLSNVKEMAKKREGEYGARRVERASDEIPNLEKMYQEDTLRSAFIGGDNARALMTMNPADFEKYAEPLGFKTSIGPKMAEYAKQGDITKDTVPTDEFIKYLQRLQDGFEDIPFLSVNKEESGLPLVPFITGHEGRHRNRALAGLGESTNLIQLLPRAELREPFPRRSQEEYIDAIRKEMEMTGNMVSPEEYFHHILQKNVKRDPIRLPDLYAEGGAAFKTLQFKDAQHFDGGGIAFPEMTPMTEGSRREPLLTEKDWENIKRNAPEVYEWAKQNVKDEASQLKSARGVKDFALRTGAQYLGGIPDLLNLGLMGVDALADTNLSSEKPYFGSERYIDAMRKAGMVGENEFPIAETVAGVLMPAGLIKKGIKKISGAKPAKQEPKKRQGGLSAMAR